MDEVRRYVDQVAPEDIRDTLRWLESEGFHLVSARGGPEAAFGDVILVLAKTKEVTITRDRSQWWMDISLGRGKERHKFEVLDAARLGRAWTPPDGPHPADYVLPEQLPPGTSWMTTLPLVLAWLDTEGAQEHAQAATRDHRERLRRWWLDRAARTSSQPDRSG